MPKQTTQKVAEILLELTFKLRRWKKESDRPNGVNPAIRATAIELVQAANQLLAAVDQTEVLMFDIPVGSDIKNCRRKVEALMEFIDLVQLRLANGG